MITAENLRHAARKAYYQKNFEYFAENELYILTKRQQLELFKLYDFQRYLNWKMEEQEKREGWIRQVWLKGRQPGGSTFAEGKVFHRTALRPNVSSIVVAHDINTTQSIFQIAKRFHERLAPWLRPQLRYSTKTELVFNTVKQGGTDQGLNSRIVIATARNIHSGAGQTFHNAHLSESARYQNADEIDSSILRAVSLVPGTMVINESTARPEGDWFHDVCEEARKGRSPYEFEFIGYNMDPTCWAPLHHPEELGEYSNEEKLLVKHFALVPEQIKWRRLTLGSMGGDEDLFHQEFPIEYEQAWVQKGANVFPLDHLREIKSQLASPKIRGDMTQGARFLAEGDGPLAIWEAPAEDAMYDIGADVALGVDGGNYSVAEVTKRPHGEQVAEYRAHLEPGEFGDFLCLLGYYYNTARLGVEINNLGYYTNARVSEKYPNVYLWKHYDQAGGRLTRKTGWETNYKTKRYMVALGKDRIYRYVTSEEKDKFALIKSEVLHDEMRHFVKGDGERYQAAPGSNDDCVMAWLIAQVSNDDETFGLISHGPSDEVVEKKPELRVQEPEYLTEEEVAGISAKTRQRENFYGDVEGWRY